MDSILKTIRKTRGLIPSEDVFDTDLLVAINAAFATLNQLGVGPKECFTVTSIDDTWSDFYQGDTRLNQVPVYVDIIVRIMFDPPTNSSILESLKQYAKELEWRFSILNSE